MARELLVRDSQPSSGQQGVPGDLSQPPTADEKLVAEVKEFFTQQGVEVSGAICFSDDDNGQFASFTYTKPEDRAVCEARLRDDREAIRRDHSG